MNTHRLATEDLLYLALGNRALGTECRRLQWFQIEGLLLDAKEPPFAQLEQAIQWALTRDDSVLATMVPPERLRPDELRSWLRNVRTQFAYYSVEYERSRLSWDEYRDQLQQSHDAIARIREDCLPEWLRLPPKYFNAMVDDSGGRRGEALVEWMQQEFPRRYRSVNDPPRWLKIVPWPMSRGRPLTFLGQLPLEMSGTAYVYVFLDPDNDAVHTIVQRHTA